MESGWTNARSNTSCFGTYIIECRGDDFRIL